MSVKKIINSPIPENEKQAKKLINTSEITHARVSLLADIFGVSRNQAISNVLSNFFKENEIEIKERIAIKRSQLDNIF